MTINVTQVNQAPSGTDKTITLLEDHSYAFAASDFGFSDPNDSPANHMLGVVITTVPTAGSEGVITVRSGLSAITSIAPSGRRRTTVPCHARNGWVSLRFSAPVA